MSALGSYVATFRGASAHGTRYRKFGSRWPVSVSPKPNRPNQRVQIWASIEPQTRRAVVLFPMREEKTDRRWGVRKPHPATAPAGSNRSRQRIPSRSPMTALRVRRDKAALTLYHAGNTNNDVQFDPSTIRVLRLTATNFCFSGFSVTVKGSHLTMDGNCLGTAVGSVLHLVRWSGVSIDAESLGGSAAGAAWIIGLAP